MTQITQIQRAAHRFPYPQGKEKICAIRVICG